MPVFRSGTGNAPKWCEMSDFQIIRLEQGEEKSLERFDEKEHFICTAGRVSITSGNRKAELQEGDKFDVAAPQATCGSRNMGKRNRSWKGFSAGRCG